MPTWITLVVLAAGLFALDFAIGHREAAAGRPPGMGRLAWRSAAWLLAGLAFAGPVLAWHGTKLGGAYLSSFLIEKAMAADAAFVFVLVFDYFAIPAALRPRALAWGGDRGAGGADGDHRQRLGAAAAAHRGALRGVSDRDRDRLRVAAPARAGPGAVACVAAATPPAAGQRPLPGTALPAAARRDADGDAPARRAGAARHRGRLLHGADHADLRDHQVAIGGRRLEPVRAAWPA